MLNNTNWKTIFDLPYEISEQGTVRRIKGTPYWRKDKSHVKPYINNKGYLCINLYKEGKVHKFTIHRLLGMLFIDNPNNFPVINHIDGDPLNNDLRNLEWTTQQQNIQHAWDTNLITNRHINASSKRKNSTSKYKGVSWSKERNKWCAHITVRKKKYALGRFTDEIEAAKAYDDFVRKEGIESLGYSTNFI